MNSIALVLSLTAVAYGFIIFGRKNTPVIVFGIGALMFAVKLVQGMDVENLSHVVDFNTLGILFGMMIIVGFLKRTGFFQYAALQVMKISKGNFWLMLVLLMVLTALMSAFLDNLITIILLAPVVFLIADSLRLDPTPLLLLTIFADNIGGSSTLIGSPLNIVLGSAAGLSFNDFIVNMGPVAALAFLITMLIYRKRIGNVGDVKSKLEELSKVDASKAITDKKLLVRTLYVFLIVLAGLALHDVIGIELALVTVLGAIALMVITKHSFEEVAEDVDWDILFLFAGLYTISYALEGVGVTKKLADIFMPMVDQQWLVLLIMVWIGAIVTPFLSAVPAVLLFAPVIKLLVSHGFTPHLWWAYAIGANLGSNLTPLGAVQNIVGVNLLVKSTGRSLSFAEYMKRSAGVVFSMILVGSVYVLLLGK